MSSESRAVKQIFLEAVERFSPDKWEAYLDQACGDDAALRRQVEILLETHAGAGKSLDGPGMAYAPTVDQPITEKPGTQIGPYKLLQEIGEGGMGVVYMADQTAPVERRVALKIIKPGMDTRQVIARFEAERQALAMMDHPNIAKVLDGGTTESGRPYFVMELVTGIPISKFCDQRHLTPRERLDLFIPVCQAVQHAHQKGVIHRDLKPSNVLIALYDDRPVPKVIDFGVAKATSQKLTEKTMFTRYGQIVGTLEYMSPEQANLNRLDVDTRSDIYSLGVLLYELLTGNMPFDRERLRGAAFDEVMRIIREEEPPKPSQRLSTIDTLPSVAANRKTEPKKLRALVRGELDWIVMKALEKDRARRYETASGFASDIQRYLNDEPVVACPPSAAYRFRKFARRNKASLSTVTVIMVALLVGIAGTTWQAMRAARALGRAIEAEKDAREQADRANREFERANREAEKASNEAAIAQAVNEFVNNDLLSQANPFSQKDRDEEMRIFQEDRDIKMRTVLDRAAEKVGRRFVDKPLVEASIRQTLGDSYFGLGDYEEAERHIQRAVEIRRHVLGEDHPDYATSLNALGELYKSMDEYAKAESLLVEARDIRKRVLGEDHPDYARSLNALGLLYASMGEYAKAESLCVQARDIRKRVLGEDHPDYATSLNSLALLYESMGDYAKAERLLVQALEIDRRVQGDDNLDYATSLGNLGGLYESMGEYAKAEPLYVQAMEIERQILGEDHPDYATSLNNLAVLYDYMDEYTKAEPLYRQAMKINKLVWGEEHPDYATILNNLALLYKSTGEYAKAEPLYLQALEIRKRVLGEEHPDYATSLSNLGVLYRTMGEYAKAEPLYLQALEIRKRLLGEEHPDYAMSLNNLGVLYKSMDEYAKAEPLYLQALEIRKRLLGEKHPGYATTLKNLASLYESMGENAKAEAYLQALENRKRLLGKEQSDVRPRNHRR
jgi:serine/threonine protein kinase/Tfp pilus assembly protein PilF